MHRPVFARAFATCVPVLFVTATDAAGGPPEKAPSQAAPRWIDATTDGSIAAVTARVTAGGEPREATALAATALIRRWADRATEGIAAKALRDLVTQHPRSIAGGSADASLVSLALDPRAPVDPALGIVSALSILGPFRDTGGALTRADGPEATGSFGDANASFASGAIDVRWRKVPSFYATARGVPLDLFIEPRSESCSMVATTVHVAKATTLEVRLASTGQARLMFDRTALATSPEVHAQMVFDRLGAKVDATAGDHVLWAKICTSAAADEGRVRLRVTGENGARVDATFSPALVDAQPAKVRFSRVTTPLERALAPKAGDAEAELAAGIVRTVGGADDAQSPRAPGLLDQLSRTPGLPPGEAALIAYVTPSAATRGALYRRAREEARAKGDSTTLRFVERQLVSEHLASGSADWAFAALGAWAPDPSKDDDDTALLRSEVMEALGPSELRHATGRALAEHVKDPKTAPSALLRALAEIVSSEDPKRALPLDLELAARGEPGLSLIDDSSALGKDAMAKAATRDFDGYLDDANEGTEVAERIARAGNHGAAVVLLERLVDYAPNHAAAFSLLADEFAASGKYSGSSKGVVTALLRARALTPGDPRTNAVLALRADEIRTPKSEPATPTHRDEGYLVPSATILARRQGAPPPGTAPTVADRELHWLRAVVVQPDRRVSTLIHYAREIVVAPRTQEELVEELPAEGDTTEILRARVHKKDGTTSFPVEEQNAGARTRIRWPDLSPGDVVEVAIRSYTSHPFGGRSDPPFFFLDYAGAPVTHPLLYNEVIVDAPKEHPLYVDVLHGKADRSEERDVDGHHIVRLVWDKPPLVPDEPLAPKMTEILPMIVASSFRTWGDFRAWYAEAVRGFTEPDAEVQRLAKELTKGKNTRDEKLRALFDFVADDIRYVNYVSAEAWLPNRPQELLARREGDCDDKAILLITLLRAVGIEAKEVMVQTRETAEPSLILAKNVALPLFDHGIAFLPGPGNSGTYLDATSPQSRLGPLPAMDARAVALRMDEGPAIPTTLPASSPSDHGYDVSWNVTLKADGSADLTGDERHVGDGAFWLRTYLGQAESRIPFVERNLLGGFFPTVKVDPKVDFEGDLPGGAARVRYAAHSDGLARHEGEELTVPLSPMQTLASEIAPLPTRTLPVVLPPELAPSHQTRTIRLTAPPGFVFMAAPPSGEVSGGAFGSARFEAKLDPKDPHVMVVKRNLVLDKERIEPAEYGAWRSFVQKVDSLLHRTAVLVPSKGAK